ncbi:24910_t:CDS:1, partial [Racocetra persica]
SFVLLIVVRWYLRDYEKLQNSNDDAEESKFRETVEQPEIQKPAAVKAPHAVV